MSPDLRQALQAVNDRAAQHAREAEQISKEIEALKYRILELSDDFNQIIELLEAENEI